MKLLRVSSVILLILLSLSLGWELGARHEYNRLSGEQQRISDLFAPSTGSGLVVQGDPEKEVDLTLFWSVWRLLNKHYLAPQDMKMTPMVYGAVSGMVDALGDPYTLFMTPKDMKSFQDSLSGTLEGIGAQLDARLGKIIVVAPLKGSPAEKAGLLPKDEIFEVDGVPVEGMKLEDVVSKIRGPKGTQVRLTIHREKTKDPISIVVTRENIHVPSVESRVIDATGGSVGLITINQFGDSTIEEVRRAIEAFHLESLKGMVLDLRYNGGGYLDGASDLVSMFLRKGNVVTVVRRDVPPEEHPVSGQPIVPDLPLVVLINGGSASASEITAGALKDHGRATLIGTQSFGKGTVQEVIDLPGGASLRVTTAKWLTPSGHDLGKKGIAPDIVVDRTLDEYQDGKDPQLDAALAWLLEHKDVTGGKKSGTGAAKN
jgi:carboxyl-terminal processing protease